jgi:hypothetical protein
VLHARQERTLGAQAEGHSWLTGARLALLDWHEEAAIYDNLIRRMGLYV